MRVFAIVLALIICAGCSDKKDTQKTDVTQTPAPIVPSMPDLKANPDTPLITVDGESLTRAQADERINMMLGGIQGQADPNQLQMYRQQIEQRVIQDFVHFTLLKHAAAKGKYAITPEEEKKEIDTIKGSLPPGMTLDTALAQRGIKQDEFNEQIHVKLMMDKYIEDLTSKLPKLEDAEIDSYIAKHKEDLTVPVNKKVRHILISTSKDDTKETKAKKKKELEDIRQQIVDGADFAKLAAERSSCPSGKRSGGDLGLINKDSPMDQTFKDAVFSQKLNELGPVFETQFGYHIVQVTEEHKAGQLPREEIIKRIEMQKKQELVEKTLQDLAKQAKIETPASATPQN